MLTPKDISQLKGIFVTKEDMIKIVADFMEFTRLQFQQSHEEIKALRIEMSHELRSMRDDIITFKDEMLGEMSDLRDDVAVVTGYRDLIADHEERITKLEKKRVN